MGWHVWFPPGALARLELAGSHRKAEEMATTLGWRASRRLARTSARVSRSRRVRTRLWTVLNAPALLQGSTRGADSAARMEDDYRRLAAGPRGY